MTPWNVVYTPAALRDLSKMPAADRNAVMQAVHRLATTGQGDVKKLKGYHPPQWRLRVGSWRVFFTYDQAKRTLIVLRVKPRKDSY